MIDLTTARYDILAPLLCRFKRRFSVLDLGAGINPYLAQRISRDFDCVYTAVEQDEILVRELIQLGPRAMWLQKSMTAPDIERLSCCEHFDVVLAMNILHHFEDWRSVLGCLESMATFVVVQTPYPEDGGTCGRDKTPEIHSSVSHRGEILGESVQFEGHDPRPIYLIEGICKSKLSMSSWTSPVDCIDARIYSSFEEKTIELRHKNAQQVPYIHGLNLWNFAMLGGQWPAREIVMQKIRSFPLPKSPHGDITPHNFLFDGFSLHLIDGHEGWEFDDKAGLEKTERMVEAELFR